MHPVLEEEEFFKETKDFSTVLRNSRDLVSWVGETIGKQSDDRIRKELQKRFLSELRKFCKLISRRKKGLVKENPSLMSCFFWLRVK